MRSPLQPHTTRCSLCPLPNPVDRYPQHAVLRRHPHPRPGAFDGLQRALASYARDHNIPTGLSLKTNTSKELADSLDAARNPADPYFNKLLRIMATRAMQQAEYFRSGAMPPDEYRHYGLAADIYTHFTSPIRRCVPDFASPRPRRMLLGTHTVTVTYS